MDDDKKLPLGADDSFEEHELDLNTPDDLKAIEDVTFADTGKPTESMAIFDELDDSDDFPDFPDFTTNTATETHEEFSHEDFSHEELPQEPMETPSKMEDPIFSHDFDFEPEANEPIHHDDFVFQEPVTTQQSAASDDEAMFAPEAFEDVNADFPEDETSPKLGDSQLFDYDPGSTASEGDLEAENIYAAPSGAGGTGKDEGPGGKDNFMTRLMRNRRALRMILMVVLICIVYAVLRMFMGGASKETTMSLTSPPKESPHPMGEPAPVTTPEMPAAVPEAPTAPAVPEAPEAPVAPAPVQGPAPVTVPAAPAAVQMPTHPAAGQEPAMNPPATSSMTVPGTSTELTTPPMAPPPVAPAPQTTVNVTMPMPGAPGEGAAVPSDQIANKLSSLEASLMAIDDRLATMSAGKQPINKGVNAFGQPVAPESEAILMDALQKIEGIDQKMSYLSELQTQIHILNKEVNALKSDVVQQSMIVGQNQQQMNQKLMANIDSNAPKMIVQAAIPGRAWLRSETGQLLTVIPGDEVPGYGRVVSIDPTTGTVMMSTRVVFREL